MYREHITISQYSLFEDVYVKKPTLLEGEELVFKKEG
jgi:hypothetical protein